MTTKVCPTKPKKKRAPPRPSLTILNVALPTTYRDLAKLVVDSIIAFD